MFAHPSQPPILPACRPAGALDRLEAAGYRLAFGLLRTLAVGRAEPAPQPSPGAGAAPADEMRHGPCSLQPL